MFETNRAATLFRDIWNPTREEVLQWAYTHRISMPAQDFELAVYKPELHEVILQCATDQACPHRYFFLGCLYVIVGDAVRSNWNAFSQEVVADIIKKGQQTQDPDVRRWAKRAERLIAEPTTYTYGRWGIGSSFVHEAQQANHKRHTKKKKKTGK